MFALYGFDNFYFAFFGNSTFATQIESDGSWVIVFEALKQFGVLDEIALL